MTVPEVVLSLVSRTVIVLLGIAVPPNSSLWALVTLSVALRPVSGVMPVITGGGILTAPEISTVNVPTGPSARFPKFQAPPAGDEGGSNRPGGHRPDRPHDRRGHFHRVA